MLKYITDLFCVLFLLDTFDEILATVLGYNPLMSSNVEHPRIIDHVPMNMFIGNISLPHLTYQSAHPKFQTNMFQRLDLFNLSFSVSSNMRIPTTQKDL